MIEITTKGSLLAALLASFLLLSVQLSEAQSASAQVTVSIRFLPVQTIAVNSSEKVADLLYASTGDPGNEESVTHEEHLIVFSSGGFQINAEDDFTMLSTAPSFLIASSGGGRDLDYNLSCDNPAPGSSEKSINRDIRKEQPEADHTAAITYTITTK